MSRTIRRLPHYAAATVEYLRDPKRYRPLSTHERKAERAERGADGAFRSDNAARARDGKVDNWSSSAKGRANKRQVSKDLRRHAKDMIRAEMAENAAQDASETQEAERLAISLFWAREEAAEAERTLSSARKNIEACEARFRELGIDPAKAAEIYFRRKVYYY